MVCTKGSLNIICRAETAEKVPQAGNEQDKVV